MDPQYSTFHTFSASSIAQGCLTLRKNGCWRRGASPKALYLWFQLVFV
jgi:hypothetical protein